MTKTSTISIFLGMAFLAAFSITLQAHPGHGHHHHGPNGGRLLMKASPDLEFNVTKDRKVEIFAVNIKNKIVPIEEQTVKVTAGDRNNPVVITFSKNGDKLVSDNAFPEGDEYPVTVEIVVKPGGPTLVEKFTLDFAHDHEHDHE